jgi:SAM-dependent methyltransferase
MGYNNPDFELKNKSVFLNPKKILSFAHISPDMVVADFETTNSFFALEAARQLKGKGKLYCIGSNKELLKKVANEAARESIDTLHTLTGNIEKTCGVPLRDGLLDLVIIANVFFSLEEKNACAQEAYRLLRNGGRVLFIEWLDSFNGIGPHKGHIVSKEDALTMFKSVGFELMKEVDADHYHYSFVFQKKS